MLISAAHVGRSRLLLLPPNMAIKVRLVGLRLAALPPVNQLTTRELKKYPPVSKLNGNSFILFQPSNKHVFLFYMGVYGEPLQDR